MRSVKLFDSMSQALDRIKPNTALPVQLEGLSICLANFGGAIYAVEDACPHLGDSLHKGTINYLGEIVCPWHAFRFNLKNGEEAQRRCRDARTLRIMEGEDGAVYLEV